MLKDGRVCSWWNELTASAAYNLKVLEDSNSIIDSYFDIEIPLFINQLTFGITKQLSYKVYNTNLVIHHIDHNKQNCTPYNCTLLCRACNTHVERKSLKEYYEWYLQVI